MIISDSFTNSLFAHIEFNTSSKFPTNIYLRWVLFYVEFASDASKRLCRVPRHSVKNSLKSSSLTILISFVLPSVISLLIWSSCEPKEFTFAYTL